MKAESAPNVPPFPALGPRPHLGYTASMLDRAAERRTDADFLAVAEASDNGCAYVIAGETIVMRRTGGLADPLFTPAAAKALATVRESVFLGLSDGGARFGFGIDAGAAAGLKERADLILNDLRSIAVQGLVEAHHLPPLAEAKAMLQWHARHRFCSNCGAASEPVCGGWRRDCPSCKAPHFPRTDPVAIMLAIDGERCLLGRQPHFAPGMWSCLAGFVEPGETIEEAARREIEEEAGIRCGRVRYFASQPWPFPMSLMIGCHAQAISTDIKIDTSELEDARWFSRDEVVQMLTRTHPEGRVSPPPVAIAHHILRAWVEDGADVFG
jgi:NAD+ diphosphatase